MTREDPHCDDCGKVFECECEDCDCDACTNEDSGDAHVSAPKASVSFDGNI